MNSSEEQHVLENEMLWKNANVNMTAMQDIASSHFGSDYHDCTRMDEGAYARVFLFTLKNGFQFVARIVLPVRESVKTQAEVAAMTLVRARTNIPVPTVYLYCSTSNNPVGAEWVLMQYMAGCLLDTCRTQLTGQQMIRTAMDIAEIMHSLFRITAPLSGSLNQIQGEGLSKHSDDSFLQYRAPQYPKPSLELLEKYPETFYPSCTISTKECARIGPVNDIVFLQYPKQLDPHMCGPFYTEREWMEAFAFLGSPSTRIGDKLALSPFEKALEVYDVVAKLYHQSISTSYTTSEDSETFHFSHGDLRDYNILVDPHTGAVTGIIDWEMAGFRPAWLAAVGGGWFNDDFERFLVTSDQDTRGNYLDESPSDLCARAKFRSRLAELDDDLFRHHFQGVELRAFYENCCEEYAGNAELWLEKYMRNEWSVDRRGAFPFDYQAWIEAKLGL